MNKLIELVKKLERSTRDNITQWVKTSGDGFITVIRGTDKSLKIEKLHPEFSNRVKLEFMIIKGSAEIIESEVAEEMDANFEVLFELWDTVRRKVYKIDEEIDDILNHI